MGESSAISMRSGAAIGRRLLLRFSPRRLSSAALGAVKILLINTTPRERYLANFWCLRCRRNRAYRGTNLRYIEWKIRVSK